MPKDLDNIVPLCQQLTDKVCNQLLVLSVRIHSDLRSEIVPFVTGRY